MKGKRIFYCEWAYVFGVVVLAFGTAMMEWADFGVSMVVAPAYLLHLKLSQYLPFFSFGVAGYVFQAVLLVMLSLVMKKVKLGYLLSFVTAFIYGLVLDAAIAIISFFPYTGLPFQILFYVSGLVFCATGVALLMHTYFPPEAYDLVVREFAGKFPLSLGKIKTIYDLCSCLLAIALSLLFFGGFVGVQWGTIVCTFVNGYLIGSISRFLKMRYTWKDALPLRSKLQ